jgi:tetratricopeptide (TPR) repeat protein
MKDLRVAEPLVRFSFTPYGVTFRWEVIRGIRSLGGYAVPALLKLSRLKVWSYKKQRTKFLLRRFAHYLLTTMPQANAQQAIAMADRPLQLLLIETYGKFRDADAVEALIALSDHPETELREAARDALRQYFVGKAPRAKARRLKLPGGEESEHLQKLYLSYRERATHEIRQALERLTRGRYDRSIPGRELMRMLFEKQDRRRRTRWTRRLEEALEAFGNGEMDQALDTADEVLRGEPQLEGRARLFDIYATKAEQLTLEGRLAQAAALLERAASLLPRQGDDALGRQRRASLADASYLRALIQEARERPAQAIALHRQALAQWEEHVGARVALLHLAPEPRLDPQFLWTLLALAALGAPGLLLLLSALGRLRRREEPEDRP